MRLHPATAALVLGLLGPLVPDARSEVAMSAGTEHFAWSEDTSPFRVKESGLRFALGLDLTQQKAIGLRFAYRGKLYAGEVGYNGAYLFAQTVPARGNAVYTGTRQQGQARYTLGPGLDALGALEIDLWRRRLGTTQTEDYRVISVRLGAEHGATELERWRLGAGLKVPIWAREDAHLTRLGFDQNPILEPGRVVSPYLELGYRVSPRWTIAGYWDGFQFSRSNRESLTRDGVEQGFLFQPASDLRNIGLTLERKL